MKLKRSRRASLVRAGVLALIALAVATSGGNGPEPTAIYVAYLPRICKRILTPVRSDKKGIGAHYQNCHDAVPLGATWCYNWQLEPSLCPGVESVPLVWNQAVLDGLLSGQYVLGGNSRHVLGPNEPDISSMSNMTPYEAAVFWHQLERWCDRHKPDALLVSPAVSHVGLGWLAAWRDTYVALYGRPPRLHGLAAHCYGVSAEACQVVVGYVIGLSDEWGIEGGVWLTEFYILAQSTEQERQAENLKFIRWMEAQPRVARYAWFPARMRGNEVWAGPWWRPLVDWQTGSLTQNGYMYSTLR